MESTQQHRTVKDYQAEGTSLLNMAMSGREVYAKQRLEEMIAEVWNRGLRGTRMNTNQRTEGKERC